MGMYGRVCGREVKLNSLAAIALASVKPDYGYWVEVNESDVYGMVCYMRQRLLDGWAHECAGWGSDGRPLTGVQDVYRFESDVRDFTALVHWLTNPHDRESQTIIFS